MKIVNETELMTNQKASTVVVPDKQFEALQTIEGNSLLFSIGLDNILYCTREVPNDTHGWQRIDLSSALSAACYNGAAVTAQTFSIAQDLSSINSVDIALVVEVNNEYYLHLATGFSNTLDNWASSTPQFVQYEFDDYANMAYAGLPINDVQIVDGNGCQYIIADVISNAETQTISRYYIDPTESNYTNPNTGQGCAWVPHLLPLDLQAGNITTLLGCGPNDGPNDTNTGGTYILGSVNGSGQLAYIPSFNAVDVYSTPAPTIFGFPAGYDAAHMAMALSASSSNAPYTDLFFASNYTDAQGNVQGGLFFLSNANQVNKGTGDPVPALIYTNDLLKDVQSIHIENWNDNIVLWGQSQYTDPTTNIVSSRLFIMEGVAGQETNTDAWSFPITLLVNAVNTSSFINNNYSLDSLIDPVNGNAYGSCSILFAHQADGTLVQLFQDPVTTAWQQRSLLVVPNDITEVYETTTYSTHIEITDDNNLPQPNLPVYVWASSPCSVYVSDANNTAGYFTLEFDKPAKLETDFSGNITLMQAVDAIGGIAFNVAVQDPNTQQWYTQVANPMAVSVANLNAKVPDGSKDYLQGTQVADEYGNETPLVSSVYDAQTATTSNQVYTVCQQSATVNPDGLTSDQVSAGGWPNPATAVQALQSVKLAIPAAPRTPSVSAVKPVAHGVKRHYVAPVKHIKKFAKADRQFKDLRFNPKTDKVWAWTYGKNAKHFEGIDEVKALGIVLNADGSLSLRHTTATGELGSIFSHIEAKIGHVVKWIKSEAHQIEQVVVTAVEDAVDCLITIAGDVYHFVAKCVTDVVNMVHTALNAIETAFKDIVAWIGMLFNFQDMLTTHAVLKNIINISIGYAETSFDKLSDSISTLFSYLESQVDHTTGLPTQGLPSSTQTYSAATATSTPPAGSKSPSAKYGSHHLKNNAGNSDNSYSSVYQPAEDLFDSVLQLIENEGTAFTELGTKIAAIAKGLPDTPFTQSITELLGAIIDLALNTAENFLETVVAVLKALLASVKDVLNATIHIPVLTYFYKKMTTTKDNPDGDDLTPLDLFCLIGGIFSTVVYKAVKQEAPFPQGTATTTAILSATDMPSLQTAINSLPTLSSTDAGLLGHGVLQTGETPLNIVGSLAAMEGAVGVDSALIAKSLLPYDSDETWVPNPADVLKNKIFSVIQSVCYMGYVLPDMIEGVIDGGIAEAYTIDNWFVGMNNLCTYIAVAKAVVDGASPWFPSTTAANNWGQKVSPGFDCILNIVWQIPTVFQLLHDVQEHGKFVPADINAIVSCIGGTFFDLSGLYSPALAVCYYFAPQGPDREAAILVAVGIISICNLLWGGSCVATTFDGLPVPQ